MSSAAVFNDYNGLVQLRIEALAFGAFLYVFRDGLAAAWERGMTPPVVPSTATEPPK